ncbi:hypothetical protein [Phyllobacterium chamaecytisi]|nr:hypothetical protein [Phyllobacterium sp. KW56]
MDHRPASAMVHPAAWGLVWALEQTLEEAAAEQPLQRDGRGLLH